MQVRTMHFKSSVYLLIWLAIALPPLISGWGYYMTPYVQRIHHTGYDLYKPSGFIGHGLGILGSLMIIVGVTTYSLRKRFRSLSKLGKLRNWLSFHIFLCSLGPFLVILHTSFRLTGIIAIAFWSMIIVVASGVFGRYVYVRIPKTPDGHFLNVHQLHEQRSQLIQTFSQVVPGHENVLQAMNIQMEVPRIIRPSQALTWAFSQDVLRFRSNHKWETLASEYNLTDEQTHAGAQMVKGLQRNAQQIALLQPFQKMFTYWHVMHIPLAMVMFVILIIHIAVAIAFGYTWIFGA